MLAEFLIFSIIGLLLTELLLWIGIDKLNMNAMIVKIVATAIVMVFNFITRKLFLE
jgi:putative flippase GtrA